MRFSRSTLPLLLCGLFAALQSVSNATEPAAPPADKADFDIYLLMGQSNMAGRDTRELEKQKTSPKVLALTTDTSEWVVARDPIHQQDGRTKPGQGPGIPFALEMLKADPDTTIGLVPCAVGGSPMKRWVRKGDLYQRALARARTAAGSGTIRGVLWLQGESDCDKEPWAKAYGGRLASMIRDLRADLGISDLPVVVAQIGGFLPAKKHPHADTVRAAIRGIPENVEHTGHVDSAGLTDKGDKLHYDADSARKLGEGFAREMMKLLSK